MNDSLAKILIYFRPALVRWSLTGTDPQMEEETGKLGRYPLDTTPRLSDGHFSQFDLRGLPVRNWRNDSGKKVHLYSTLCCFGLAHWDLYTLSNDEAHKERFLAVADYIRETGRSHPGGFVVLRGPGRDGVDHEGVADALDLGQGISVLVRAWQVSGDASYLKVANGCAAAFTHDVREGGVTGEFAEYGVKWYEEAPEPPARHILNGMICALWGLRDLAIAECSDWAKELFRAGVQAVASTIHRFDTGYWSLYWVAERPARDYIATMNYHTLHIRQLSELHRQTGVEVFREYADRFETYARSPVCRGRALLETVRAKLVG